jgi:hypothetical protein
MKRMNKKVALVALSVLASNQAMAAGFKMRDLINHPQVKNIITLGFALVAILEIIEYAQNFELSGAVKKAIRPAIAIFMYFKWQTVFNWIGLT